MTLTISEAEATHRSQHGESVYPPTHYLVGFLAPSGKVLAIHRESAETRIWFQQPAPPKLEGVHLLANSSNGNSYFSGSLLPLGTPKTLRIKIDSSGALTQFLDWNAGAEGVTPAIATNSAIDARAFRDAFARIQARVTAKSGRKRARRAAVQPDTLLPGKRRAWDLERVVMRRRAALRRSDSE